MDQTLGHQIVDKSCRARVRSSTQAIHTSSNTLCDAVIATKLLLDLGLEKIAANVRYPRLGKWEMLATREIMRMAAGRDVKIAYQTLAVKSCLSNRYGDD